MSKKWEFTYEEECYFEEKHSNYEEGYFCLIGIITNGKDYLFYEELPEENMVDGTIYVYSSILRNSDSIEIAVPNTKENKQKILDALNSLTEENADRFCGENSILHEIQF